MKGKVLFPFRQVEAINELEEEFEKMLTWEEWPGKGPDMTWTLNVVVVVVVPYRT